MVLLPKICVPIVHESQVLTTVEPIIDFYEVRIDLIGKNWRNVIKDLKKPWIACNRRVEDGGKWAGNEDKRIKELFNALDMGAPLVDIELGTPAVDKIVKEVKGLASIIISYHNLEKTPPLEKLQQIVTNQLAAGADICKVVTTARSTYDNTIVLKLIKHFPEARIIAFAMGINGQISRLLCPLVGGYFTWASSEQGNESASGQIPAEELRHFYRMMGDQ